MIVDDNPNIRMVLNDILSIGNHEVVGEASNGVDAVKKFSEIRPDLLLLDLAMPKKDGFTVIQEIKSNFPDAKIIIVTATSDEKIIDDCLDAGAQACINKPFVGDKILEIVSEIIGKWQKMFFGTTTITLER